VLFRIFGLCLQKSMAEAVSGLIHQRNQARRGQVNRAYDGFFLGFDDDQ
jgi:hypothetical protein